jgi:hypothetical protein
LIDSLVERAAAALRQLMGFPAVTTSADALMEPSATSGDFSRVVEADFATVDDAKAALQDEAFQGGAGSDRIARTMLSLYELAEIWRSRKTYLATASIQGGVCPEHLCIPS